MKYIKCSIGRLVYWGMVEREISFRYLFALQKVTTISANSLHSLGNGVMVAHRTLDAEIGVRLPVPQPKVCTSQSDVQAFGLDAGVCDSYNTLNEQSEFSGFGCNKSASDELPVPQPMGHSFHFLLLPQSETQFQNSPKLLGC